MSSPGAQAHHQEFNMPYCLQIIPDPDDAASYRWIIL
ncbi:hypothetical protein KYG_21791, partial [Acidovorax sp. NO-1]